MDGEKNGRLGLKVRGMDRARLCNQTYQRCVEIKSEICEKCRKEYVEEVNEGKLIEGRVDGEREKKAGFLEKTRSIGAMR